MARSEARIKTRIWKDEDFRKLTRDAQGLFMFLLSQDDLAHDGTLALRERRWSRAAAGLTVADIERDLKELEAARYLVIDWDAEEVLIRSFIRGDRVYRQPNVLMAAADHLELVSSPILRAAIAEELDRILAEEEYSPDSAKILTKMREVLSDVDVCAGRNPQGNPSGNPSEKGSRGAPGERGDTTAVTTEFPVPQDPDPRTPVPPLASLAAAPRARATDEPPAGDDTPPGVAEQIVQEWITTLRKPPQQQIVNAIGTIVQAALGQRQDPGDVRTALRRWQAKKGIGPQVLISLIHEVANEDPPGSALVLARASPADLAANGHKLTGRDAKYAETMALAAQLRAQEGTT